MKKSAISTAIVLALGAGSASAATTITLLNNTSPTDPFPSALTINNAAFAVGNEFRVMNNGSASGFGEKTVVDGLQSWSFNDSGQMTAVAGTAIVPLATVQPTNAGVGGTGPGIFLNATFFGGDFGFLAPTVGSAVAAQFGEGTIQNIVGNNFEVKFPTMEAHWNNGIFTIGSTDPNGVVMSCTGWSSGTGQCTGEQIIAADEDSAGFTGQYTNFDFAVSVEQSAVIPVPAAVWLFGSGLLGLVGVARRKKTNS